MIKVIKIRNVEECDIESVVDIQITGWQAAYIGIIDQDFLDSMDRVSRIEKRKATYKDSPFIVAENDDKEIVGFARYTYDVASDEDKDYESELRALYVRPDLKKQGIGRLLFEYIKTDMIKHGKNKMILWCLKENYPSRRFYEKMGGQIVAREKYEEFGGKKYPLVGFGYDLKSI